MRLLRTRQFLPLFITQFLGAFNDNLLKNALVMVITFRLAAQLGDNAQILVIAAAGLFILPFFLFSATAGQFADKYDRSQLTRIIKLVEIAIMAVAVIGFYTNHVTTLMIALFGMGMHSTFFGPIKYALLPQHLPDDQLLSGNAYIEAGTFLAILIGTIAGGVLILQPNGILLISIALLVVAVAGYLSSRSIPAAPAPQPEIIINKNIIQETIRMVRYSRQDKRVFRCILGISWFWLVGATFLAQFPSYAKDVLHADGNVVTLFLTVFSLGIGIGSFLCNRLLNGRIQTLYVPLAALGISAFGIDFYIASLHAAQIVSPILITLQQFLNTPVNWRVLFDLLGLSICSGLYIVPLYAVMQHDSAPSHRARIIAANNIINALFMVVSALLSLVLIMRGFTIPQIFLSIALGNLLVAVYICKLLPDALPRTLLKALLFLVYRIDVKGLENYTKAGQRVLIVANHTSFLDAALIAASLPDRITFAANTHIAAKWWMKPVMSLVNILPLDPTNPLAIKSLIDTLKQDKPCMIFPEGRITTTGALMKIYEGPGMIADKANAMILPIRIDGAQYTPFSRLKGKVHLRWFPKISLTILPPRRFALPDDVKGRKRRQLAGNELYNVMSDMMFASSPHHQTLVSALIGAQKLHGRHHIIAEDVMRKPLTYGQFLTRAFVLGKALDTTAPTGEAMGILLPTAITTSVTLFGLQLRGRVTALLNFTAGSASLLSACKAAQLSTIVTSKRFITMTRLQPVIDSLEHNTIRIVYLEDIAAAVSRLAKLGSLLKSYLPQRSYNATVKNQNPDAPAAILFTSGSEGTPKGVVLSHSNILSNIYQLASRIDFGPQDKVFNALPMFHAFGLMGGTLLPLLSGIKTFYYPSPLHYRIIPELIYDTNSTILFGTDTFLAGYARFANPYDFYSIRYIFAGAERLKDETRRVYADKFGVRVFEGYGATETAPGIALNTPMHNRQGSVGRILSGLETRLETVTGITEGQKLWVKGPNVMLGYLFADNPGVLTPIADGWYDTGDIVAIDDDRFVTIKGRTKRFAKIAGEMISLTAVENALNALWPDALLAVVSIPDAKKGEQLVILTTFKEMNRDAISPFFKQRNLPELALPRVILQLADMPLLGTGKVDYQGAKKLAEEQVKN